MLRRTIIVLALLGACYPAESFAQRSRPSLSDRFESFRNFFRRDSAPEQSHYRPGESQPEPPMPYDPRELENARSGRPSEPPVAVESPTPTAAPAPSRRAAARAARRSPLSSRRDRELDEALADLLAPADQPAKAAAAKSIDLPTASGSERLPDYLRGLSDAAAPPEQSPAASGAKPALRPTSPEPAHRNPFDLHSMLTGDAPPESTPNIEPSAEDERDSAVEAGSPVEIETDASAASPVDDNPAAQPDVKVPRELETREPSPPSLPRVNPVAAPDRLPTAAGTPAALPAEDADEARQAFVEDESPAEATSVVHAPAIEDEPQRAGDDVLFSYRQPAIQSRVAGPRRIIVGQEAVYEVTLANSSETPADAMAAAIEIPAWAEVVDATPTTGIVQRPSGQDDSQTLRWQFDALAGHSEEKLAVRLIPRDGRPLQLRVHWTHASVGGSATVEVQEPKLAMAISGPDNVRFGEPQRFRLTLSNPGTGVAKNIVIRLTPPGGAPDEVIEHPVGELAAGATQNIELELVAREPGALSVVASASADGGVRAETSKEIACLKPELKVDYRGPERRYAGARATYYFRVRNPGAAATGRFAVTLELPQGAKLVSCSKGGAVGAGGEIRWDGPSLGPGEERFMQISCELSVAGRNDLIVTAETLDGGLRDAKSFATEVVALADLKLEVSDPTGPIAVGDDALYTVRIVNRGSTAARGVNVVALFSSGINPTSVEGAQYSIHDGRVAFKPISSLPAGGDVLLRIQARATQPGTHRFRTEVVCPDLETKLAAEETTRFFAEGQRWNDASSAYSTAAEESAVRR